MAHICHLFLGNDRLIQVIAIDRLALQVGLAIDGEARAVAQVSLGG